MAETEENMDKAKDEIEKECEKHNISVFEGTGPDYEKQIKMIHKDRVRWARLHINNFIKSLILN